MVFGLFRPSDRKAAARTPEGTVVYAVGDVHGCLSLLLRLEEQIAADMARRPAERYVVVYLGDYVDRGPDSRGVMEHLSTKRIKGSTAVHLAGNHDRWMLRFLDDASIGAVWLQNGGREALASYGLKVPYSAGSAVLPDLQQQLRAVLPAAHRKFLERLRLSHEEGDYFFAHAGVRPGVALAEQTEQDLTWIREEFLYSDADFGKVVVHGHTPSHTPEEHRSRICIDTGAFMSGKLTALILDGSKRRFLHT